MSLFEKEKAAANACSTAVCMPTLEAMVRTRDEHKNGKWNCSMGFVEHIEGGVKAAVSVMSGAVMFRVTLNTAAVDYDDRVICRCRYSAHGNPCFHAGLALEHAAAHAALKDSHVIFSHANPLWYSQHRTRAAWVQQYDFPGLCVDISEPCSFGVFPPSVVRGKGRPRKRRYTSASSAHSNACAYCGETGHHRSSCATPSSRHMVTSAGTFETILNFPEWIGRSSSIEWIGTSSLNLSVESEDD